MKRFFALMSALVMCLSLIGAAPVPHAHAEEVCAHEITSLYYISKTPEYHALTCDDCGAEVGEMEAHVLGGYSYYEDGTHVAYCDVCHTRYGEEEPCVAGDEYIDNWEDATHSIACSICDGPVGEKEPHVLGGYSYREDGTHAAFCNVCYAVYGEEEPCVAGDEYTGNWEDATHSIACSICGGPVGEKEPHVLGGYAYWDNDTHAAYCNVCYTVYGEKEPCVAGDEYAPNWGEGTHSAACSICDGPVGEAVACTPGDEYIQYADEEGYHRVTCGVCGGALEKEACTPGSRYVSVWEDDDTTSGHYAICAVCDCPMGEVLPHTMGWFRSNGIWCAYGCAACNYTEHEEEHDWDPASYKDTGDGIWHSIICKRCGGEGTETHWIEEGKAAYTSTGDLYTHAYSGPCAMCGATKTGEAYHTADSCDATACSVCGQEGVLVFRDYIEHEVGEWLFEDGKHYQICENCDQKVNVGPCEYYCYEDGCWTCGQKNPGEEIHWSEEYVAKADGHYWVCGECGNERFIDGHAIPCDEETGSWCWTCGEEYPDLKPAHSYGTMSDETGHWEECWICGDKKAVEKHVADCLVYGYCAVCWEELPADTEYKHFEIVWMNTGKQHWSMCSWCGEIMVKAADHTPSDADKTICSVCGGKINLEDTHEHGWKTREIPATCTKDGFLVDNCPTCGIEMGRVRVKATGHQYGEYTDNGDGTQTAACTVCGETMTEKIEEPAEEPAEAPAEEPVEEPVEEPAAAPAPVVEGEAVPENAVLEVKAAEEIAVAEDVLAAIEGTVEKAFTVALIVDEAAVQPEGEVTVKLPVTDEEIAQLEGKVIMVIAEDGTVTEVAYEIVENELIIKTEILGTFIIVAKAA